VVGVKEFWGNGDSRAPLVLTPYMAFEVDVLRFLEASCVLMLEKLDEVKGCELRHELDLIRYELRR